MIVAYRDKVLCHRPDRPRAPRNLSERQEAPEKACKPGSAPLAFRGLQWPRARRRGEVSVTRQYADNNRKKNYGITWEQFDWLVRNSEGRCAICQRPSHDLVPDHDHKTAHIRGLLCDRCNRALMYVERHGYRLQWFKRVSGYLASREGFGRVNIRPLRLYKDGRLPRQFRPRAYSPPAPAHNRP